MDIRSIDGRVDVQIVNWPNTARGADGRNSGFVHAKPALPAAGAASDIFLHVQARRSGKVKGESVAPGHEDDIVLSAWRWGARSTESYLAVADARAARRSYASLTVVKGIDRASTGLLAAMATNDALKEVKLVMRRVGGAEALEYWTLTLKDARVQAIDYETGADGGVVEVVAFGFVSYELQYRPQSGSGAGAGGLSFQDDLSEQLSA